MTKTYTQRTLTGQAGINLIEEHVLQMGWVWNATSLEAGIDGYIEIRDPVTGRATNVIMQVQSKALSVFTRETETDFEFVCSQRDLEYWLSGNAPVILIVSRPATKEAYWISIKDYFHNSTRRQERRVIFDKRSDRFDLNARERLSIVAMPKQLGIYLTPPPRVETLYSNLLRIKAFPASMYRARTEMRDGRDVRRTLGWGSGAPDDWILRGHEVISFREFDYGAWNNVIEPGTADRFNTTEWAESQETGRTNEFLELMFRSLRSRLRSKGISYFRDEDYFYFTATPQLKPRRVEYKSLRKSTARTVFQGFPAKDDPTRMRFYRHLAFTGQFHRFDNSWFLSITPTYHFTFDGWERHKWYESKLKGIKALEKNSAVLGQVSFWAAILRSDQGGLFELSPSELQFGDLASGEIDAGINEGWWLWNEEDETTKNAGADLPELPLAPRNEEGQ